MRKAIPVETSILNQYTRYQQEGAQQLLNQELEGFNKKIVVLDDDPTGVQTIHDVSVYTDWNTESILAGFQEACPMFFILTNSRSMSAKQSETIHKEIARNLSLVSQKLNKDFILISRGDSTLRGHYPLETEVLKNCLEQYMNIDFDREIIYPFFQEGGRYTINQIHYVRENDRLIPAGLTEFARDQSFGYQALDLADWCEEKTKGRFPAENIIKITINELRRMQLQEIEEKLIQVQGFNKVVVDSLDESDVMVFMTAFLRAVKAGKHFLFRSAATVPKILCNIPSRPLLTKKELVTKNDRGGIVLIGSHVKKTTLQMEELRNCSHPLTFIEFHAELVHDAGGLDKETNRVRALAEEEIIRGRTVVVYTSRSLVHTDSENKDKILETSVKISEAVTAVIGELNTRPSFIIAKGGITSSDVGTKALRVKKATVMGQIKPGIPVWQTGAESKFPGLPYIIFPGNVGEIHTLKEIVELLM